jgi:hypothetical protein
MKNLKATTMVAILLILGVGQASSLAGESSPSSAGFERLKSLAGEWAGTTTEGEEEVPANTSFRLVSDGSALMNELMGGTPEEMITMFHMDGSELMATHYCTAHNQPRFLMAPSSDPKVVNFEFKDATNLASPTAPHMVRVKFTLVDANRHTEEWTYLANGQEEIKRFDFHRKN